MENLITVVVDAMGGDNAPHEIIKGAVEAVKEKQNLKVLLVGQKEVVEKELSAYDYPKERIEVIHASEVIETGEPPVALTSPSTAPPSSLFTIISLKRAATIAAFIPFLATTFPSNTLISFMIFSPFCMLMILLFSS